jgi:hypothetical protein
LANAEFHVAGSLLAVVCDFLYLGRWLSENDLDDLAVTSNIKKARQCWGRLSRILTREGANPRVMARFYVTVIEAVLLYGSETWVLSSRLLRRLNSFHNRCARHLAHRHIRRLPDGTWEHPSTNEVLDLCGLSPISTYIAKRQTSLLHRYAIPYSAMYNRCLDSKATSSSSNHLVWWTQEL